MRSLRALTQEDSSSTHCNAPPAISLHVHMSSLCRTGSGRALHKEHTAGGSQH